MHLQSRRETRKWGFNQLLHLFSLQAFPSNTGTGCGTALLECCCSQLHWKFCCSFALNEGRFKKEQFHLNRFLEEALREQKLILHESKKHVHLVVASGFRHIPPKLLSFRCRTSSSRSGYSTRKCNGKS